MDRTAGDVILSRYAVAMAVPDAQASGHSSAARNVTIVLFVIYAVVLVGLVLFKFPFSYDDSGAGRHLNLIPLAGSFTSSGVLRPGEIVENVLVFVPFGIYLSVLARRWPFWKKLLPIIATTVVFEAVQYAFAIGRADITDVLGNALGGAIGIGIYALLTKLLGARTDRVIVVVASILTLGALAFYAVLFLHSNTR
jgi:glycopeptide antibiotics resistance protein